MQGSQLSETMQSVMDGHQIVRQFHKSTADMFRALGYILEEADPAYELLSDSGEVMVSTITHLLRSSSRWSSRHFSVAYSPIEDDSLPLLLVNVSVDSEFSPEPEIWMGVLAEIESSESFPFEQTIAYLYADHFVPDDEWTESGEWYEETIDDDGVQAFMSFLRLPLEQIDSLETLEREVAKRFLQRVVEVTEQDKID